MMKILYLMVKNDRISCFEMETSYQDFSELENKLTLYISKHDELLVNDIAAYLHVSSR